VSEDEYYGRGLFFVAGWFYAVAYQLSDYQRPKKVNHAAYIRVADNAASISESLFYLSGILASVHRTGVGIGLAFVKLRTSLHKGDIYVYSERSQHHSIPATMTRRKLSGDDDGGSRI
jgi:signal transduction histidine kinase